MSYFESIQKIREAFHEKIRSAEEMGDTKAVAALLKACEAFERRKPRLDYLRMLELGYRGGAFGDK
jgi:hypothetical protein